MKVQWTVFDHEGYRIAHETYSEADPKDFEHTYEGEVIDKYQTFWAKPKFIVALPDGCITTVPMTDCIIVQTEDKQ